LAIATGLFLAGQRGYLSLALGHRTHADTPMRSSDALPPVNGPPTAAAATPLAPTELAPTVAAPTVGSPTVPAPTAHARRAATPDPEAQESTRDSPLGAAQTSNEAPSPPPVIPPGKGIVATANLAPGRRIFVDEITVGQTPESVAVECGTRTVRIGS